MRPDQVRASGGVWRRLRNDPRFLPVVVTALVMLVLAALILQAGDSEEDGEPVRSGGTTATTRSGERTATAGTGEANRGEGVTGGAEAGGSAVGGVGGDAAAGPAAGAGGEAGGTTSGSTPPSPAPGGTTAGATAAAVPPDVVEQICQVLRLAGRTPVRAGSELYGPEIDPDGNGVACE